MAKPDQSGMNLSELKNLLRSAAQRPVNCAIGCGSDATSAFILLDRVKSPAALAKELEKSVPQVKNTRFGTVSCNLSEDPSLVTFIINKPVSGMVRRLVSALKGTGFHKVNILLEAGQVVETTEVTSSPTSTSTSTSTRIGF